MLAYSQLNLEKSDLNKAWVKAIEHFQLMPNEVVLDLNSNGIHLTFYNLKEGLFLLTDKDPLGDGKNSLVYPCQDREGNPFIIKVEKVLQYNYRNFHEKIVTANKAREIIDEPPNQYKKIDHPTNSSMYLCISCQKLVKGCDLKYYHGAWEISGFPSEEQRIKIALACLEKIQHLHDHNIAYKDVHEGQFILNFPSGDDNPHITLIDFDDLEICDDPAKFKNDIHNLRTMLVTKLNLNFVYEQMPKSVIPDNDPDDKLSPKVLKTCLLQKLKAQSPIQHAAPMLESKYKPFTSKAQVAPLLELESLLPSSEAAPILVLAKMRRKRKTEHKRRTELELLESSAGPKPLIVPRRSPRLNKKGLKK